MKKLIYSLFVSFFALTLITSCDGTSSKVGLGPGDLENDYNNTISQQDFLSKDKDYAPRNLFTKAVQKAIRFIIKNKRKSIEIVEHQLGKKYARAFEKSFEKLVKELKPLLDISEFPSQSVYDAVRRGMIAGGASEPIAVQVAMLVKTAYDVFGPL